MAKTYDLKLKIHRFDPDTGREWVQAYELQAGPIMRFVDVLRKLNDDQDATLAWSSSCEHGQCGSCSMVINGKPMLACDLLVENAVKEFGTTEFEIRPVGIAPKVRDLVTDTLQAYDRVVQARPWIISPAEPPEGGNEYPVTPDRVELYEEATRCINCFCCAEACITSHRTFLGPNAMLAAIVRIMDQREGEKDGRFRFLHGSEGIRRCHTSRACSHVCPKEIDVSHFLALAKDGTFKRSITDE